MGRHRGSCYRRRMPRTRSSRVQGRGRCNAVRHRRRPYEAGQRGRPAGESSLALAVEPRSLAARMQPDAVWTPLPVPLAGGSGEAAMVAPMPTAAVATRLSQEEVGDAEAVVFLVKLTFGARFRVSIRASVQTRMAVG